VSELQILNRIAARQKDIVDLGHSRDQIDSSFDTNLQNDMCNIKQKLEETRRDRKENGWAQSIISSISGNQEDQLTILRKREKDLGGANLFRLTSHATKYSAASAVFGGLSATAAMLPLVAACVIM
jgi:hypothetical protein